MRGCFFYIKNYQTLVFKYDTTSHYHPGLGRKNEIPRVLQMVYSPVWRLVICEILLEFVPSWTSLLDALVSTLDASNNRSTPIINPRDVVTTNWFPSDIWSILEGFEDAETNHCNGVPPLTEELIKPCIYSKGCKTPVIQRGFWTCDDFISSHPTLLCAQIVQGLAVLNATVISFYRYARSSSRWCLSQSKSPSGGIHSQISCGHQRLGLVSRINDREISISFHPGE